MTTENCQVSRPCQESIKCYLEGTATITIKISSGLTLGLQA
uniref:Uncharacterized protein n=1 Tax=Arundo donax TaxID=35708 RepID=A0A0A9CQ24_ARUDO